MLMGSPVPITSLEDTPPIMEKQTIQSIEAFASESAEGIIMDIFSSGKTLEELFLASIASYKSGLEESESSSYFISFFVLRLAGYIRLHVGVEIEEAEVIDWIDNREKEAEIWLERGGFSEAQLLDIGGLSDEAHILPHRIQEVQEAVSKIQK